MAKFDLPTNTWSAVAITAGSNSINTQVNALALHGNDLYVGGSFTEFSGGSVSRTYSLAKVNTTTGVWEAVGTSSGILHGGYDTVGFDGVVNALALNGDDLYVGGSFLTAYANGMMVSVNRVAKLNTTTGAVSALGAKGGNGLDNYVKALASNGDDLFVGGNFLTANVGGTTVGANHIAKVNLMTGVWSTLGNGGGDGVNGQVNALMLSRDELYVGGNFLTANLNGTTVATTNVAKVNTTTGIWSALGSNGSNGVNGQVNALALSVNDLYVGGQFIWVGGTMFSTNNVAKVSTTTGVWSALADNSDGNGVNNNVNALAMSGTSLFVGGSFTTAGDRKPSQNIGRFFNDNQPTLMPTREAFAANGGKGSVMITMPMGCPWTATNHTANFVTITSPTSGAGNDKLTFLVAANPNPNPRSGIITINSVVVTISQGANFQDVPPGHSFYTEIGKLSAYGITQGCSAENFCPDANVTREQMAIFIERALGVFAPPPGPTMPTFADVPNGGMTDYGYEFIEDVFARGITQGCAAGPPRLYCPSATVSREQVAIFILRALGVFTPPPGPKTPTFADVPNSGATDYSYEFIEEFVRRGITSGCAAGPPRLYCPMATVTRGQMAAFLVRAFNL